MQLSLQDNHLVLDFPYDASQVAEVKKIDGSSWDRVQKVWRLPMSSLEEARQFAAKHKFTIDIDVLTLTIQKKRPEKCVFMSDANLMLRCPYEKVIIKAVKQIPGITWNSDKKVWQAPLTSVAEVIGWAKSFDVPIAEEIHSHAVNVKESLNKLKDASRSTDAEIKVASIKGDLLPYQRAGVAYASNARRTFIADEMGLGKTLQAMDRRSEGCYICNVGICLGLVPCRSRVSTNSCPQLESRVRKVAA